ncbi:MAG: hypothetical protein AMXMBFR34_08880 [Myxococcaceae bacterium]
MLRSRMPGVSRFTSSAWISCAGEDVVRNSLRTPGNGVVHVSAAEATSGKQSSMQSVERRMPHRVAPGPSTPPAARAGLSRPGDAHLVTHAVKLDRPRDEARG